MNTSPSIGLAFSGGGFRATAFGLGCLRALHDDNLLPHVRVVSGVSGGALLAAMWAYGPASFDEFDDDVTALLRQGLQGELLRRAIARHRFGKKAGEAGSQTRAPKRRPGSVNRTDALVEALASRPFGTRTIEQVTHPDLATVISATDLITTNAVRFGSMTSSCSAHGRITDQVRVSDAVAASAAFPLMLPVLRRSYEFDSDQAGRRRRTVALTDGGVYDNLALSPLLPGRSPQYTHHVYELDYVIAVDAGRGRSIKYGATFLPGRMARTFDIVYARMQDGGRAQLHLAAERGELKGFVHAYLAMQDRKLPIPVADFVPRAAVVGYPTNFAAMSGKDIRLLTSRGAQLMRTLVEHYCPELRGGL